MRYTVYHEEATMTPRQFALTLRDGLVDDGYVELQRLRVRVPDWKGFTDRTFGACSEDGQEIILAPDLAKLPQDIIEGVVMHEIGHALDFLYPGRWGYHKAKAALYDTPYRVAEWRRRPHDVVERLADDIAEAVFGRRIRYRGCFLLQSTATGAHPRPAGLY